MDRTLNLTVPEELDGERVDKAVAALLEVSRAEGRRLVESGALLDGSPARPSDRVTAGSLIETPTPQPEEVLRPEPVDFSVVHEDGHLIVVDKPPGLVVHPGSGKPQRTLAAGLLHRYPELRRVGPEGRAGLVHRLDRDTSGLLLVARTEDAFRRLTEQLAQRRVGRTYTALVDGLFSTPTGTIDAPIGRDPQRPTRRAVLAGGRPARTHYRVEEVFPARELTLLEVTLETGRTHQIRVHLAAIDHPVVGDRTYSAKPARIDVPRIFLHARRLRLEHPATGEEMVVESGLPEDLSDVLRSLRRAGSGVVDGE